MPLQVEVIGQKCFSQSDEDEEDENEDDEHYACIGDTWKNNTIKTTKMAGRQTQEEEEEEEKEEEEKEEEKKRRRRRKRRRKPFPFQQSRGNQWECGHL